MKDGVFQAMMEVALVNDGPVHNSFPFVARGLGRAGSLTVICQVTLEVTAGRQQEAEDLAKPGST